MEATLNARAAPLTGVQWLILATAGVGFAFDMYEVVVQAIIVRPMLRQDAETIKYAALAITRSSARNTASGEIACRGSFRCTCAARAKASPSASARVSSRRSPRCSRRCCPA
ncbi:MAG TPA: hypothetical protein VFP37_11750 [Steroidobacteraceae bacterium]|nr:hypothetical protein [Steroidobacteraceae bacterium]